MGGTNDIVQNDDKYNVKIKKENIILNLKLSDSDVGNFYVKVLFNFMTDINIHRMQH